jgi:hypothetical protein
MSQPWVPPRKVYRIRAKSGLYEGLDVSMYGVPLGRFVELATLSDGGEGGDDNALEEFKRITEIFEGLAAALVEWNIHLPDADGNMAPVPPTLEGVYQLDFELAMWIFEEWLGAMGGTGPLDAPKPNAEANSPEPDLALSLASQSLPSSEEQT